MSTQQPALDHIPVRRERTPGHGLDGPPCPERDRLPQGTPAGLLPREAMCCRCGRVTARRDGQGRPWCGGTAPTTGDDEGSGL